MARPLDGVVLTHWGACAPARGPATAPWPPRSTASTCSRRSLGCARLRRESEVERGESDEEERESKRQNELGFRDSQPRRRLLYRPISPLGRRMQTDGADSPGRLSAQAGARARPNSRPRPRLRPGRGGERGKRPRGRGPWAALRTREEQYRKE